MYFDKLFILFTYIIIIRNKKGGITTKGKKVISLFLVTMLSIAMFSAASQNFWQHKKTNSSSSGPISSGGRGNTLIGDQGNGRVIEVDNFGNIVWQISNIGGGNDAERLDNGNTLTMDNDRRRVIEVDNSGNIVWQLRKWKIFFIDIRDVERLPNGNTLIVDSGNHWVIEVDSAGNTVWQRTSTIFYAPTDVERLANGNTMLVEKWGVNRVIEVDNNGIIVWQFTSLNEPSDAERLANGNTLISDMGNDRVIEVDSAGNIVWQVTRQMAGLNGPCDAERLTNGNTLITDLYNHRVIEVDSSGNIVWQMTGVYAPTDAERIESVSSPNNATIDFDPDTLNLKSKGKWVTVYIELPNGSNVSNIDATTVLLNGNLSPVLDAKYGFVNNESGYIMDHDGDGILERMLKFNRSDVQAILAVGDNVEIKITGKVNGLDFEGTDIIRVINPP